MARVWWLTWLRLPLAFSPERGWLRLKIRQGQVTEASRVTKASRPTPFTKLKKRVEINKLNKAITIFRMVRGVLGRVVYGARLENEYF